MGCCSGVVGGAIPSDGSKGSNALHGAINTMEGVVEIARTAAAKASGVLGVLHESVFPDKDMPEGLGPLAGAFDKEGDFLQDLVCDSTVSGLETMLMVLMGHGMSIDYDAVVSSVPEYTRAQGLQPTDLARCL